MHVDFIDFVDFIQEYSGKICFLAGVTLLASGVLFLNRFGTVLSAVTLFFGIVLTAFGMVAQLGLFSVILKSWSGLGAILLCASVVCFAFSVSLFQFMNVELVGYSQMVFKGALLPFYEPLFRSERPYVWVSGILMDVSLVLLIIGLIVEGYSILRY